MGILYFNNTIWPFLHSVKHNATLRFQQQAKNNAKL